VSAPPDKDRIALRHLRVGWYALLVSLTLGLVLEALHAIKAPLYLDAGNETRRLMWRLAHAHGTLVALVNIAYGLTVQRVPESANMVASRCLLAALVLLPLGFFGGGIAIRAGDPGIAVALVPAGGVALAVGVALVARSIRSTE
jgi:hypothetical protein